VGLSTCAQELPLYDDAEERTWRHLDSGQYQTHLHARIPRVECGEQGVVQVRMPWAEARSRFTLFFVRLATDVLGQWDVTGATKILRVSWDEAWGSMERAVTRGRQRKSPKVVRRLGVDEKAVARGHRYLTLVCDLEEGTVGHIAEDRKQESLDGYYWSLSPKQLEGIEAVAVELWEPYIQAALARVPEAAGKVVFDRFHVMGYLGKAVDTVRHIDNILTYFQHPVTNAMSEGLNSKIQKIKSMAGCFRNLENFKTAIYFHCGGLELYPC
jgi:transposase